LNYNGVIRGKKEELAPAGSQREADTNKAKANDHVPSTDTWDWVLGLSYVESHDPK
jgi:hypothetical protein